jgi:hypothetical protein
MRQGFGIDGIGFFQEAEALGKTANMAGIDQGDRELSRGTELQDETFVASGGFDHDPLWGQFADTADELRDPLGRIRDGEGLSEWPNEDDEFVRGHIDPDPVGRGWYV